MKAFILWLSMVFIISVAPLQKTGGMLIPHADKLLHFMIYAVTCALFWSTLRTRAGRWALPLSVILATLYGYLMEIAQGMVGYRHFSCEDLLANFLGALTAALYIWIKKPVPGRPRRPRNV